MPNWLNLANLFTLLRLVLVPFVLRAIVDGRHTTALVLFIIAAFTDYLDGFTARRLGIATQSGAYLDPIADKCLLSGLFLALAWAGIFPWWLVALIFGRDIYILLGVALFMLFTPIRRFPPSVWGKVSTFVQIVTAVTWLTRDVLSSPLVDAVAKVTLWPCAAFTLWSGIHYTWRGVQIAGRSPTPQDPL